jgi:hypothetical protein
MTFGYLWAFLTVCVKQLIRGHAYDEYLVWHKNQVWQLLDVETRYAHVEKLCLALLKHLGPYLCFGN